MARLARGHSRRRRLGCKGIEEENFLAAMYQDVRKGRRHQPLLFRFSKRRLNKQLEILHVRCHRKRRHRRRHHLDSCSLAEYEADRFVQAGWCCRYGSRTSGEHREVGRPLENCSRSRYICRPGSCSWSNKYGEAGLRSSPLTLSGGPDYRNKIEPSTSFVVE